MAGYIHFTDEQKQRANSVDLVGFLRQQGEKLIRSGREWRWKRHDSVTVRGNQWFRHSVNQGGLAIDFVQEFYGLPFPEAVTLLLDGEQGIEFKQSDKNEPLPKRKEFILPEASDNMRRVYAYLLKQRYIDRDVLTYFVREKKIFEDKEYHNVVFVGFDENSNARHAHKRGTYSNVSGYRGNVEGSDPRYSFNHLGTSNTVYVFEAPIDMLSFISLHQKDWRKHSYVTLDGVAEHAMIHILLQNKHLSNVVLCLDHDLAGIEAAGRLKEILFENGYAKVSCLQPAFKDWNEDLKAQHGIIPIPTQEHPKIEACRDLCGELRDLCSSIKSIKNANGMLREHYEKFISLIQDGKVMYDRDTVVMEQMESMASYALVAIRDQYRQIEKPVTIEQLIGQLFESYRPHKDRDRLRVKADNLKQNIDAINEQLHTNGLSTLADKQKLISSYMSLALNCVKVHVFIDLESQEQKNDIQQKENMNQFSCEQRVSEELAQPQYSLS